MRTEGLRQQHGAMGLIEFLLIAGAIVVAIATFILKSIVKVTPIISS